MYDSKGWYFRLLLRCVITKYSTDSLRLFKKIFVNIQTQISLISKNLYLF